MPDPERADEAYSSDSLRRVIAGILHYMVEHPDAKDTVEGIGTWWKTGRDVWPAAELHQALTTLAARDWVVIRDVAQGVRLYGVNPRRLTEMRRHLEEIQGHKE